MVMYNVHNEGLNIHEFANFETWLKRDIAWAKSDPQNNTLILVWDTNLQPSGKQRVRINRDIGTSPVDDVVPPRPATNFRQFQTRWNKLFDALLEISLYEPSHFGSSDYSLGFNNRIFSSISRSTVPLTKHTGVVQGDPFDLYAPLISTPVLCPA